MSDQRLLPVVFITALAAVWLCCSLRAQTPQRGSSSPAAAASNSADTAPYILGPNDVIQVRVYQEEDLNARERVQQDGTIALPLLGPVPLAGKSVESATALIRQLLAKDYLVNPEVTVSIVEYAKRRFTILGHVQRPGPYEMPHEKSVNLLQAIATAGGYTRIGSPRKITVQRIVNGESRIFRLDAGAMSNDRDKTARPFEILPEDTITVGEKLF